MYGRSILNNSEFKNFFYMEEDNINTLNKFGDISEEEKLKIRSLSRGECVNFIDKNHILLKIESSDFEKSLL